MTTQRRRERRFVLWVLPLLGAMAWGGCKCGPSNTTGPDGQNLGPLLDVLGAMCNYLSRCPGASPYPIAYRSQQECVDILEFLVSCQLTSSQDNSGQTVLGVQQAYPNVDAQQAQACIAWLNQATCSEPFTCTGDGGCSSPCAFLGGSGSSASSKPPPGLDQACNNAQCAPGFYCESAIALDAGTSCQVCKPMRGPGGDCIDPPYVACGPGLFCPSDGGGCAAAFAAGAPCNFGGQCDSGFCNPRTSQCDPGGNVGDGCTSAQDCRQGFCDGTGHCQNLLPNGASCSASTQCQAGNCDTTTQKCGRANGVSCSSDSDCQGYCNSGTCAAKLSDGTSCQSASQCQSGWCDTFGSRTCYSGGCHSDSDCAAGQFCDSSAERCTAQGATGAACQDNIQCQSGSCSLAAQTCGPKPALGSKCSGFTDCLTVGYCANGVCTAFLKPDQACTDIESCAPPFVCLKGKCTLMPLTCAPAPTGSTCTYLSVCDQTSFCDPLNSFTCEARVGGGAACTRTAQCGVGLFCNLQQRTCAADGQAGASCGFEQPCAPGLFCDSASSQCSAPKPDGAPCSQSTPAECQSGSCAFTANGTVCVAACIPPPPGEVPACHPRSCPSGLNCGSVDDGCGGQAYCGSCSGHDTCGGGGTPNICGCTPTQSACLARQCNTTVDNGCGLTITCGSTCPQNQTCGGGGLASAVCGCATDAIAGPARADGGSNLSSSPGSLAWDTVGQVSSQGSAAAHVWLLTPGGYAYSEFLVASGFGFQLPPSAVINGIEVTARAESGCQNPPCAVGASFDQAELLSGGQVLAKASVYTSIQSNWTTAQLAATDPLWGYPWLPAQLNSPDFSVAISVKSFDTVDVYLDDVRVTVRYAVSCCQASCSPGQQCGPDGCGGQCGGGCAAGQVCVNNFSCAWAPWTDSTSGLTWSNEVGTSCAGFDAGGFTDWHQPTIDQLRTLVRDCAGTQSGGACAVTDVCDAVTCDSAACDGVFPPAGPGPQGCYLPEVVNPSYCFLVSTTPVVGDAGTWMINYDVGRVQSSCALGTCNTQTTCVRP